MPSAARAAATAPAIDLSGTWEGLFRSEDAPTGEKADTRIERQAWRLEQHGRDLAGFLVIELTMISGDGRPFLCSQTPRFSSLLRVDLRGRVNVRGDGVTLQEVGKMRGKGPCVPRFRSAVGFSATVTGEVLIVEGGGRRQTLYRRQGPRNQSGAEDLAAIAFPEAEQESASFPVLPPGEAVRTSSANKPAPVSTSTDLHGYWVWENQSRLPNGDVKNEREEWHLEQDGGELSGFYDRAIEQQSTDGQLYRCNGERDFRVVTRYRVSGSLQGKNFVLYERGFEVIEPSPCDDGKRRLDAYQGEAGEGELHLIWGVGRQTLKRARPTVPTQRF